MLTTFMLSNSFVTSVAMEDAAVTEYGSNKPILRNENNTINSLRLKGDVSFTDKNIPISISLRDSDVKQVLRMFADKAGMNIIFHNSVAGTVTLDLVDVPLNEAFDMVMEISDLNYVVQDKTIIVAGAGTSNFNLAKQNMTLIPVKYVSASALADFLNKNIYSMNKSGISNSQIVTTNPVTNELIVFGGKNDVAIAQKIVDKFDKKPQTTIFKVNHTTPAEMANMICNMLMPASGASGGGGAGGGQCGDVFVPHHHWAVLLPHHPQHPAHRLGLSAGGGRHRRRGGVLPAFSAQVPGGGGDFVRLLHAVPPPAAKALAAGPGPAAQADRPPRMNPCTTQPKHEGVN